MRILKMVFSFMFSRLFLVAIMILLQISLLITAVAYFSQSVFYVYLFCHALSFIVVIAIVNNDENPCYKITWIFAILAFPMAGGVFYLFFGNKRMPKSLKKRLSNTIEDMRDYLPQDAGGDPEIKQLLNPSLLLQGKYIQNVSGCPMCDGTSSTYFPLGEYMYESMIAELRQAKKYILLEFFIVRPGFMWDTIFQVLKQKIGEGVQVYMMYDDLGSINSLPKGYDKIIRSSGIKLCVVNPFRPRVSPILNYRDHRKILVVDGIVGFCGGINLSDEYINKLERFGHWKDTGVMLKGEVVWEFVLLFLQQWQFNTGDILDFEKFHAHGNKQPSDGLVQVFGDSPFDGLNITETAYLNIISRAVKYVYITTPYLIIDYEMEQALCAAAQTGIDVRIITPYKYDKWYVHTLTRSHYKKLIEAGVKIYEYTPGFIHSKMFVSDDSVCMVGTCNMDFRSFYLHFECSVAFYNSSTVRKVKQDMLNCQQISHQVSLHEASNATIRTRIMRAILKVFAPLM